MRISLDNGYTFLTASEAMEQIQEYNVWDASHVWDAIVEVMDDEIREKVHRDFAPCSWEEFLEAYLKEAKDDIIIG